MQRISLDSARVNYHSGTIASVFSLLLLLLLLLILPVVLRVRLKAATERASRLYGSALVGSDARQSVEFG